MRKLLSIGVAIATLCTATYIFVGTSAAGALAQSSTSPSPLQAAEERIDSRYPFASQAVFMVMPYTIERERSGGTGFLVELPDAGKVVVTNRHVCETGGEETTTFVLEQGSKVYVGRLRVKSKITDLCLIKAPREITETRKAYKLSPFPLKEGEEVAVFGHPYLRPLTRTIGHFLNIAREPINMAGIFSPDHIMNIGRIDFMVFPGNSGSPLLNAKGDVVGVIFAMEGGTRTGLFVPLDDLRNFLVNEE